MQDLPHILKSRPNLLEINPYSQFKRILRVQAWRDTLYYITYIYNKYILISLKAQK